MPGGAKNQAKLRCTGSNNKVTMASRAAAVSPFASAAAGEDSVVIGGTAGRPQLRVKQYEPTKEDLLKHLARVKKDTPLVMVAKKKLILQAIVDNKKWWMEKASNMPGVHTDGQPLGPHVGCCHPRCNPQQSICTNEC